MSRLTQLIQSPAGSITEGLTRTLSDAPDPRWIQTFTGRAFCPLSPRAEDICIEDIAHALAMKCRFTGHTREFYSVAQHSVTMSFIVPPADRMWALLHDAAEAYLPDVARPIKGDIQGFDYIERKVMYVVCRRFEIPAVVPESVKRADLILLATECRDLMSAPPYRWRSIDGIEPLGGIIHPLSPDEAEREFIARFANLTREGRAA